MEITTYNPYNNEVLGKYKVMELDEIKKIISNLNNNQKKWRENIDYRIDKIKESRGNFEKNMNDLAKLMSSEMGKPISQSIAEVKKHYGYLIII